MGIIIKKTVLQYGDASKLIYYQDAIIFYDYSTNFLDYLRKEICYAKMRVIMEEISPGIWGFISLYPPLPAGDTKNPRNGTPQSAPEKKNLPI
ncbi:hypothetical protein ACFLV7_08225 [Chloroflexota bacterium]